MGDIIKKWSHYCENPHSKIAIVIDEKGEIWKKEENNWKPIQFNQYYRGYYPACYFTKIIAAGRDFLAAGMGKDGYPYLYRSMSGDVWESVLLEGGNPVIGFFRVQGRINELIFEEKKKQIYLLCDNGELVIIPDCPKCLKILKVSDYALKQGELFDRNGEKTLVMIDEKNQKIRLNDAQRSQIRISMEYAIKKLSNEGLLVDLRTTEDANIDSQLADINKKQIYRMELDQVSEWLENIEKNTYIFFLCNYGTQADEAARFARRHDFYNAYSLGGICLIN